MRLESRRLMAETAHIIAYHFLDVSSDVDTADRLHVCLTKETACENNKPFFPSLALRASDLAS